MGRLCRTTYHPCNVGRVELRKDETQMVNLSSVQKKILWRRAAFAGFLFILILSMYTRLNFALLNNYALSLAIKILVSQTTEQANTLKTLPLLSTLQQRKYDTFQFRTHKLVLGNLYWKLGQQDLALEHWHDAGIEPVFFLRNLSNGDPQSDLDYIERAIALAPNRSELLYYKGFLFEKKGEFVQAKQWYDLAERLNNWSDQAVSFEVLYQRGQLLYEWQKFEMAYKVLSSAVKLAENNHTAIKDTASISMAYRRLGLISQTKGQYDLAESYFVKAIELNPKDFWNYLSLGLIAEAKGEPEEVIFQHFERASAIAPRNLFAYIYPASFYHGRNQIDRWRYFCEKTPSQLQMQQQWEEVCVTSY